MNYDILLLYILHKMILIFYYFWLFFKLTYLTIFLHHSLRFIILFDKLTNFFIYLILQVSFLIYIYVAKFKILDY